jgi:hypothetical protein
VFCGLTTLAAEPGQEEIQVVSPLNQSETSTEIFPISVEFIEDEEQRQIIRTYILSENQSPSDIPRNSFERDGWLYTLADITEQRPTVINTQYFTKTVELETESNELNEIIALLHPTIEYRCDDGFEGILHLDITSVSSEIAGHRTSSFTVTASRTYPNLSSNDVSLIPRNVSENGRTLTLDSVAWEVESSNNVDFHDIPNSFRAVAQYSANATRSVVTGYITTAVYSGEISRISPGDTVYTAYFIGAEMQPEPEVEHVPETAPTPDTETEAATELAGHEKQNDTPSLLPILLIVGILLSVAAVGVIYYRRSNVKVYQNDFQALVAKDRVKANKLNIDLTPLKGEKFGIEIDKSTARHLSTHSLIIKHGTNSLNHKIAFEGNTYRFEVDFALGATQSIHK